MENDNDIVYEIFERIDDSNLFDTEDRHVAEEYYERGYSVK